MIYDKIETEFWIREVVSKVWKDAEQFGNIGTEPIVRMCVKANRVAGTARQRKGIVEYNLTFACTAPREEYIVTIVHELAHILQYRLYPKAPQAHGPEFRTIMELLGYSGRTYHSYNVSKAKQAINEIKTQDTLLLL